MGIVLTSGTENMGLGAAGSSLKARPSEKELGLVCIIRWGEFGPKMEVRGRSFSWLKENLVEPGGGGPSRCRWNMRLALGHRVARSVTSVPRNDALHSSLKILLLSSFRALL